MNYILSGACELGLIYALVAFGVFLTFRVLNFPDLTVDGSFPLGAAVVAVCITHGVDPTLATLAALIAGMLAGCVTGILHVHLRIMGLLASILTMTALYSINLRVMGKPNIALMNTDTLISNHPILITSIIVLIVFLLLARFLATQYGLALRASGINPKVSRTYGVNIGRTTLFAIALSNGLVALAGALFAQTQGFADVSLGTGTIIIGLASVMIGEVFVGSYKIQFTLFGCILGSIIYRVAIAFALNSQILGLQASDLNLVTSLMVIVALMIPSLRNRFFSALKGENK